MRRKIWLAAGSLAHGMASLLTAATIYVDANISGGAQSGADWGNAFSTLTQGLAAAASGDSIWLAQGRYYPADDGNRNRAFTANVQNVSIYGGFTNGMPALPERDWNAFPAVLSGEIQQDAEPTNNSKRVLYITAHGVRLDGLTFTGGYGDYTTDGVGLYNMRATNIVMANCLVVSNLAGNSGAGMQVRSGSMTVTNCVFRENRGDFIGGGINVDDVDRYGIRFEAADCRFVNNGGVTMGGGLAINNYATGVLARCLISGNRAVIADAGGFANNNYACTYAVDCIFNDNHCSASGGGAYFQGGSSELVRCVFVGNRSTNFNGGAINTRSHATINQILTLQQCVFVCNYARVNGGGLSLASTNYLQNCTFTRNWSSGSGSGGALYAQPYLDRLDVRNSVFWGDRNAAARGHEMYLLADSTNVSIAYTLLSTNTADYQPNGADVVFGPGHLTNDPLWPAVGSGTWTAALSAGPLPGQCTLTDAGKSWAANEHAGRFMYVTNPAVTAYYIASNSATGLAVWGNADKLTGNIGDGYEILDVHPLSRAGRWTPLGWTEDAVHSPGIDAGEPAADFADEPRPNGRRLNLGAYGNTAEASQAVVPAGTVFSIH